MTRSSSVRRAITATKNGAVLRSTAAIAGPARTVPSASPTSDSAVPPRPISAANAHRRRVRGRRAPNSRRNGSITRKPSAPRENAVKAGVVWRSATSVTLNAAPQKIIVINSRSGTGMRARPFNDA